jgi:hypothetical protein
MAERIEVRTETVRNLGARLGVVADRLRNAKVIWNDNDAVLVSNLIDGALGHFNGKWSDKRGQLVKSADSHTSFLNAVAQQFGELDKQLSAALGAPPGSKASAKPAPKRGKAR